MGGETHLYQGQMNARTGTCDGKGIIIKPKKFITIGWFKESEFNGNYVTIFASGAVNKGWETFDEDVSDG